MINNYEDALAYIYNFQNTKGYDLEKMRIVAKNFWNPQNSYKIIHITGTNGKGSTCNMCFSILKKAKKKVWIFTSPHLLDIRERFRTNDGMISKDNLLKIVQKIEHYAKDLSYFEKCTLIAFEYFKQEQCEYAVIEVGVWGLLDSTNIISPEITCITTIWFDHMELLWNTLEEIAFQKAGIIKPNIPIVINKHNPIIENIAHTKNAPILFTDKKIATNLLWIHQTQNAALAFEIMKYLWISEKYILQWLQEVQHKGRLEYKSDNILIDGAHNEEGLKSLANYLSGIEKKFNNIVYCFSIKKWKEYKIDEILWLFGDTKHYIIVKQNHEILADIKDIESKLQWIHYEIKTPKEIKVIAKDTPNTLYVVFWSLYMIGGFYE